jgi:acyl-coenzyme A thioesterase PaaI-like protein
MLDESYGTAVQLALDATRAIATLDLRIDYQKPVTPGLDIKAHSICYGVTRSIASYGPPPFKGPKAIRSLPRQPAL